MGARSLLLPLVLALLMAAHPGAAQSNQATRSPSPHRSTGEAVAMGLASIAIPTGTGLLLSEEDWGGAAAALVLTSWILGPSPGLFYVGNADRAWDGMGFREIPPSVERFNAGLEAAPRLTLDGRVGAQITFRW